MAIAWLNYVFEHSPTRGGARLVLLTLADRADDQGVCWPSVADIAKRAGISERHVRRIIAGLVRAGELAIVKRGGGIRPGSNRKKGTPTTYRLVRNAETLSSASGFQPQRNGDITDRVSKSKTLTSEARNPDMGDRETMTPASGEPPVEPRGNPHSAGKRNDSLRIHAGDTGGNGNGKLPENLNAKLLAAGITWQDWRAMPNEWRITQLLDMAGCDASFRNHVAKLVPLKGVICVLGEMYESRRKVQNPPAWIRRKLERSGYLDPRAGGYGAMEKAIAEALPGECNRDEVED